MNLIICGGGTAGHITPGISIAETVISKEPNSKILFIGREGGDENSIIRRRGFELKTIKIQGIARKLTLKNIKSLIGASTALVKSRKIIKDFVPDAVIGTGGYVCWPVIKAAQTLNLPTAIHESNVYPGLSTRLLYNKCDRVFLNFPGSEKEFKNKEKLIVVGNPLLNNLISETRQGARKKLGISNNEFLILSFGGSGGSEIINKNVVSLMKSYCEKLKRIRHVHATGKKYYTKIKTSYPELAQGHNGCIIYPFIEDISTYLRAADIVICRCGAMTLSEIASAGAISILIPSPNVTDNHQYKNGKLFVDKGAALMIEETELNERTLLDAVRYLENNALLRQKMKRNLSTFAVNNAREEIYTELCKIIK